MSSSAVKEIFSQFNVCLQNQSKHSEEGILVVIENEANVLIWSILFGNFPPESQLHKDLKRLGEAGKPEYIKLEVEFPPTYPLNPPFIRVVFPRFQFHTGHVTIGGSLCIESLVNTGTPTGWQPTTSMWAIFVQCKQLIVDGGGRVDFNSRWNHDYTKQEAQAAFTRVAGQHGWITKAAVASAGLYVPSFPAACNPWWDQNQVSTLSMISLPGQDPMDNGVGSMRHKEAMAIAKIFVDRWDASHNKPTIVAITRVQNLRVFDKYYMLQELTYIAKANEKWMFHGLKTTEAAKAIVEHGFDTRVSVSGYLGAGIYCAEKPDLANNYTAPDAQGTRYCLYGRFLIGETHYVRLDHRMHPNIALATHRRGQTYTSFHAGEQRDITRCYDSQSSHMSPGHPFSVLFSNEQAYPDYVVAYKTHPH